MALRRLIHLLFSLSLLLPLLIPLPRADLIYSLLALSACWLSSLRLREYPLLPRLSSAIRALSSPMERGYERCGWLGAVSGIVGVLLSYLAFGRASVFGVISLSATDWVASLFSGVGPKLPRSRTSLLGAVLGFFVMFLVTALLSGPLTSLGLSLVASLVEAYGVEDNLELPVLVSLTAWCAGVVPP